jgi:hypothetical protein
MSNIEFTIGKMGYNGYYIIATDEKGNDYMNDDLDKFIGIPYDKFADSYGANIEYHDESGEIYDVFYPTKQRAVRAIEAIQKNIESQLKEPEDAYCTMDERQQNIVNILIDAFTALEKQYEDDEMFADKFDELNFVNYVSSWDDIISDLEYFNRMYGVKNR